MPLPTWTLQDRIRKAREHAGLKQDELARKLDTTRQTLGRWENGSHTPTDKNLQALAEATGVPIEWFNQHHRGEHPESPSGVFPQTSVVEWTPDGLKVTNKR